MQTTSTFISALGGYRYVAERLGEKRTTVHNWTRAETFPAAQYHSLRALAREVGVNEPDDGLFPFKALPPAEAGTAA
jgi:hypothetical protein